MLGPPDTLMGLTASEVKLIKQLREGQRGARGSLDYEYRALKYEGEEEERDLTRSMEFGKLYHKGWRIDRWIPCHPLKTHSGVCVISRAKQKDTPCNVPIGNSSAETVEYEYLALQNEPRSDWDSLLAQGWTQQRCVPLGDKGGPKTGHIHLLRRPSRPIRPRDPILDTAKVKAKPAVIGRLWTEAELEALMLHTLGHICAEPVSVLNERAMQADLCSRLERRNVELLDAIQWVVNIAFFSDWEAAQDTAEIRAAIREHLYPLVLVSEGGTKQPPGRKSGTGRVY